MPGDLAEADHTSTEETASGTTPEQTIHQEPEAAAVETAAPTALETTTTPPAAPERRRGSDVDSYEEKLRAALAPAPAEPEPETPQGTPAAEPAPETPAEPAPATPVEPAPAPAPAEDDTRIPDRIRISGLSDADRALTSAAVLLAKAHGIPISEAMALVSKPTATAASAAPEAPAVRDEEQIKADIAAKREAKKAAAREMKTEEMVVLDDEIDTLRDELDESRRASTEKRTREEITFQQEVDASRAKAAEFYGDAVNDPNSELTKRAVEIAALLEQQENPLIYEANAPLRVYQMAANEKGIAPGSHKKAAPAAAPKLSPSAPLKPAPVKQVAVVRPVQPAVQPASGAARTSQTNGSPGIGLSKAQSPHEYDKKLKELGVL